MKIESVIKLYNEKLINKLDNILDLKIGFERKILFLKAKEDILDFYAITDEIYYENTFSKNIGRNKSLLLSKRLTYTGVERLLKQIMKLHYNTNDWEMKILKLRNRLYTDYKLNEIVLKGISPMLTERQAINLGKNFIVAREYIKHGIIPH